MRMDEIGVMKPLTADELRIASLKKQKDVAKQKLKAERDRQKLQRAQQQIRQITQRKA